MRRANRVVILLALMAFKLFANSSLLVREEPLLSQEQLALLQQYQRNEEYLAAFPLDLNAKKSFQE